MQWEKNLFPPIRNGSIYFTRNEVILDHCWWSRCNFCRWPSQRLSGVTAGHQQIFANSPRLKRAGNKGALFLCASLVWSRCIDWYGAWPIWALEHDLYRALFGPTCDLLWPWPEVKYLPSRSERCICCDTPQPEEHDGDWSISLAFFVKMLFGKKMTKRVPILMFADLQRLNRWPYVNFDNGSRATECFSPSFLPIIVSQIMACFRRNVKFCQIWQLVTYGDLRKI